MKFKVYSPNCVIEGDEWRPIIVITNDKYTFFANNEI